MAEKITGITDMYKQYKSDYNEDPYKISSQLYRKILKELMLESRIYLLAGKDIKMPFGLGKLYISRNRPVGTRSNSIIDWKKTKIVGKRITFHNLHTNDYVMRLKWDKYKSVIKNRSYYKLTTLRTFRAEMAKHMKTCNSSIYFISKKTNAL